jgi:hypothetical protein
MSRRAVALVFGLGMFASVPGPGEAPFGGGLPVARAQAEETAESCLAFRKSDIEKGIAFDIESSCGMKLACKVSWTVQCAGNDGKVESRTKKSESFGLAGGESRSVPMSAAACSQSWKVEDVRWGCDPVTK